MEDGQIIRIPYKYSELINTMEDCECGKLMKGLFSKDNSQLNGLTLTYYNIIIVDIINIENQVKIGKKSGKLGGRPKKEKTQGDIKIKTLPLGNKKPNISKDKIIKDKVNKDNINKELISKDITTEVETFGNKEINDILLFLCKSVGIDEFKESQKWQRVYGKHFCNYIGKNGKEDFINRLKGVLSDDFKASNSNSIKYLYNEVKAYIYNPMVETEKKNKTIII